MKYNKEIIIQFERYLNNELFELIVVADDDGKHNNIHIINENYADDEMNTLYMQEPVEYELKEAFLISLIYQFFIWHKEYHEVSVELGENLAFI